MKENLTYLVNSNIACQVSWSELTKNAEAAVAAQTLQLVQHSDVMAESESATNSPRVSDIYVGRIKVCLQIH